jgi:hypothetical protein
LQPVDRPVDFVGEVDTVVGGERPATRSVAEELGNLPRTDFWTFEILGSVAVPGRATEEHEERKHESNAASLTFA